MGDKMQKPKKAAPKKTDVKAAPAAKTAAPVQAAPAKKKK